MIRRASPADAARITASLARAFASDPYLSWLARPGPSHAAALRALIAMTLEDFALPNGEVFVTDDGAGAALWIPPGAPKVGFFRNLVIAYRFVTAVGWSRASDVMPAVAAVEARHPKAPHFYLNVLGVDPAQQRRGYGRALVAPTLARCDRERAYAYLETATETNVRLYESLGFAVRESFDVPHGGPHIWTMWRTPK